MRIPPRDARTHVAAERFQHRDAGGDVSDVDLEDARHGVGDTDPGYISGFDLPRRRRSGDRDRPRDDAQAHQAAQGDFAPLPDMQVPQEDDGEGGADEVGDEGEDALGDEDVHYGFRGEAFPGVVEVPDFVDRGALEDGQEEEGEVGDYEEED